MPTFFDYASAGVGGAVESTYRLFYVDRKEQLPNGEHIESSSFELGGCSWRIYYYPNGDCSSCTDHASIFLVLDSEVAEPVMARAAFTLLDRAGNPVPGHSVYTDVIQYSALGAGYGFHDFIHKEFLEASKHLGGDCITIACEVTLDRTEPPICYLQQLPGGDHHLMDTDVTFQVGGETFSAHKCVLAAWSPVFEAELFSSATREGTTASSGDCIRIDGMLPQVFKALLHFVYNNSLPEMTELEQLLVAADKYDMQRLKKICEERLSRGVNENTAAKLLMLAVQHRCHKLREACIRFLEHPPALEAVMATDDGLFEHVVETCPALLKDVWADWFEDDSMQDELGMCLG